MIEIALIGIVFWVVPLVVFCYLAGEAGKDVRIVFLCAFVFGLVGGLLAYFLLPPKEGFERTPSPRSWEAKEAELERQRQEAELRALGKVPDQGRMISKERRAELEKLLIAKKR